MLWDRQDIILKRQRITLFFIDNHSISFVFEISIVLRILYITILHLMHFQRNGTTFLASNTQSIVGIVIKRIKILGFS
jgi:hypothetical protein